jgi:hypothetical protein
MMETMTPIKRAVILAACILFAGCHNTSSQPRTDSLEVLFIGNSYIYYNNLPDILEGIARSVGDVSIAAQHHTHGGHMLYEHLEDGHIQAYLDSNDPRSRPWDYVILQEQSTLGARIQQARAGLVGNPDDEFNTGVKGMRALLESHGHGIMLYMTWAKKAFPEQIDQLAAAYDDMGDRYDADVAPVGIAFAQVSEERSDIELYLQDGSHPSPAGSYLAACVFYAELTGQSALGASRVITGAPWNGSDIIESGTPVTLVELPEETAAYLQQMAFDVVRSRMER